MRRGNEFLLLTGEGCYGKAYKQDCPGRHGLLLRRCINGREGVSDPGAVHNNKKVCASTGADRSNGWFV